MTINPDDQPVNKYPVKATCELFGLVPPVARGHLVLSSSVDEGHPATRDLFYEPHTHTIREDWPLNKKDAVARHIDLYHSLHDAQGR